MNLIKDKGFKLFAIEQIYDLSLCKEKVNLFDTMKLTIKIYCNTTKKHSLLSVFNHALPEFALLALPNQKK